MIKILRVTKAEGLSNHQTFDKEKKRRWNIMEEDSTFERRIL